MALKTNTKKLLDYLTIPLTSLCITVNYIKTGNTYDLPITEGMWLLSENERKQLLATFNPLFYSRLHKKG